MDLGLTGRRVLVTGGSKGIGLACARAFADAGCDVTIAARDAAALEAALASLRLGHRGRFAGIAADLARVEEGARLVAEAGERASSHFHSSFLKGGIGCFFVYI